MHKDRTAAREQVWKELRTVAKPDSRFHFDFNEFIPDYAGSEIGNQRIRELLVYKSGHTLFITPDNNLTSLREGAIMDGKTIIMPTYGIIRGFLIIARKDVPQGQEAFAATLDGMDRFAEPISLEGITSLGSIDVMVTGASVITLEGLRFGKGHGYFDLEWAMMRMIGVVDENTPLIAVAHDCQITEVDIVPEPHDTIIDYIVTPSQTIEVASKRPKPEGINWDILPAEMREQIPPLRSLYRKTVGKEVKTSKAKK
jgi:5-formyltetrahydrofolate cyclo-ligase